MSLFSSFCKDTQNIPVTQGTHHCRMVTTWQEQCVNKLCLIQVITLRPHRQVQTFMNQQ